MLHQTFLFLGQLWQLFEVSQILEFLRYSGEAERNDPRPSVCSVVRDPYIYICMCVCVCVCVFVCAFYGPSVHSDVNSLVNLVTP